MRCDVAIWAIGRREAHSGGHDALTTPLRSVVVVRLFFNLSSQQIRQRVIAFVRIGMGQPEFLDNVT